MISNCAANLLLDHSTGNQDRAEEKLMDVVYLSTDSGIWVQ
jgi:hypothetical protein